MHPAFDRLPVAGEAYRHRASGLRINVDRLPGRARRYAGFLVPYGANDLVFETEEGLCTVPPGTAHYLEHCIFHRDAEGGLLGKFARLGIDANAFTAPNQTQFYFTAVEHLSSGLEAYLQALFEPQLDEERIEAEREIILAEYQMYLQEPQTQLAIAQYRGLYRDHPLREDICGSEASIRAISAEDLRRVTRAFYRPERVELCLAGDFPVESTLERIDRVLQRLTLPTGEAGQVCPIQEGSERPLVSEQICQIPVQLPLFSMGIRTRKPRVSAGRMALQTLFLADRSADVLLGEASPEFQRLSDQGLINDHLQFYYYADSGASCWVMSGSSREPERAVETLVDLLEHAPDILLSSEGRARWSLETRGHLGRLYRGLDSVTGLGSLRMRARLFGLEGEEALDLLAAITPEQAVACFKEWQDPSLRSVLYAR